LPAPVILATRAVVPTVKAFRIAVDKIKIWLPIPTAEIAAGLIWPTMARSTTPTSICRNILATTGKASKRTVLRKFPLIMSGIASSPFGRIY